MESNNLPEMFHLQYPASRHFMTWAELRCLCRALGFPGDLFRNSFNSNTFDIKIDEQGLEVKSIFRIIDLNLLYHSLHLTYNMHTADWNTRAMTSSIHLLGHRILDFAGVYSVRVAYMTYEHMDMKGMLLNRHILLRSLKMCGRVIAPLKLMHRIKHTKAGFEEKGRIQLHEFFTLILWCDLYIQYNQEDTEMASGKEGDLFQLVDFHKLLSHYDQRVARQLNLQYLKEERDFGLEQFGSKQMFEDATVNTDAREAQVEFHSQKYRHLKNEVNQSQRRVYRAQSGSVRPRPISAPDLNKYRGKLEYERPLKSSAKAIFEFVQTRLHSAPPRAREPDINRPTIQDNVRALTPRAVTPRDLQDLQLKMNNLHFDMSTLNTRCRVEVENEMMFYIPGYQERLSNKISDTVKIQPPQHKKRRRHWTSKIINNLVYPSSTLRPTHAKSCDARFLGWIRVTSRPGSNSAVKRQHSQRGSSVSLK